MATIQSFEELRVWQKARILCNHISEIVQYEMFAKDFKLKDQINSSSGSIMDNIAEGYGRKGNLEFINFLSISHGLAMECKSQLYRAFDRSYITSDKLDELKSIIQELCNMMNTLINYLSKSELKGVKYKQREK